MFCSQVILILIYHDLFIYFLDFIGLDLSVFIFLRNLLVEYTAQ